MIASKLFYMKYTVEIGKALFISSTRRRIKQHVLYLFLGKRAGGNDFRLEISRLKQREGRITFSLSVYSLLPLGGQQVMRS